MAPNATLNPRAAKAFSAMNDLGISRDEVEPVLQELLRLYDKKWEYIEEDNYRTLIDAYFELKEDKEAKGKRKALISCNGGERKTQPLAGEDDVQLLTMDNSRQILAAEKNGTPLNTSGREIIESSHCLMSNTRPKIGPQSLKTRISGFERISKLPRSAVTDRKSNSEKESSASHGEDPVDKPSSAPIRRENIPNGHYRKEMIKPRNRHINLHLGSSSTSCRDPSEVMPDYPFLRVESVDLDLNSVIDDSTHNDSPTSSKANIDIASSPSGEVKISLYCGRALRQPNYNIPSLNAVMKLEEKHLKSSNIVGPKFSMVNALNGLCENFLKLGMNTNKKCSHPEFNNATRLTNGSQEALPQDDRKLFQFLSDITKGSEKVFFTGGKKGWGLRTLEDLPRGSFVCEYVGEILTNMELYERIMHKNGNDRHTYPVTLDADWGSEGVLKDEEALCLDATYNGNVARFINHRCTDGNLIDIPVEVETPDRHYYHLAFFTNKNVRAYEELTWDYGIDFDDHDHPIKAFQCHCGSPFCHEKKRKGKRKSVKR
ncbi:hypothetical protein K1719_004197 [Acacia pycnantha]|nr:hypothetical protein K1719_004197 [Acacia pycnantha]